MTKNKALKYEKEMQEFLSLMQWEDELDVDAEKGMVSLSTGLSIDGQSGKLIIEANSNNDIFNIKIYFNNLIVKTKKIEQMKLLIAEINSRFRLGKFSHFDNDGSITIFWQQVIDFEGGSLSALTIKNNFQPGWNSAVMYSSAFASVALTNQSAEDAMAEFDEEQKNKQQADEAAEQEADDGPSEL